MKIFTTSMVMALCLLPLTSLAAPSQKTAKVSAFYVCSKCHMKFSASMAKKDHYKDPMDGGTLVAGKAAPTKTASKKPSASMNSMGM